MRASSLPPPEPLPPTGPVVVENPSDGGLGFWLVRYFLFGLCALGSLAAHVGLGAYLHYAGSTPPVVDLSTYGQTVSQVSTITAWDGQVIGELAHEYRLVVPFEKIPETLRKAFVAAEDHRFYQHGGLDWRGLARAAWANLRAGQVVQGGSTITQQVAKAFLSSERTLDRKVREAILARRIEARYGKDEILGLYLNHIFLGGGAYGVGAAARRYFDKEVWELDLGESALVAGLARAPSRDSPLVSIERAQRRRDEVLARMVETGAAKEAEAAFARTQPLKVRPRLDLLREVTPYFTEHVRREAVARHGDQVSKGGMRIETTVLPWVDVAAQENVDHGLRKLDKRQGWRGPEARLRSASAREEFVRRARELYGSEQLSEGRLYLGLVEKVDSQSAQVRVGAGLHPLPLANMRWAAPYSRKDPTNDRTIQSIGNALRPGDVIWVRWAHRTNLGQFREWVYTAEVPPELAWVPAHTGKRAPKGPQVLLLEQTPTVQGAMYTYDHSSGYVLSMVGGDDFDRSEFNRAVQACRQPGSTYKPVYYSAALDRGASFATTLNDTPRAEVDPITGEVWTPTNLNNEVDYQCTLERALVWSKNIPSVQLFGMVGAKEVEKWARQLGFTTQIIADKALALGASCVRIDEITRAFSAFARSGAIVEPVYIRRVIDGAGNVLEDASVYYDPTLPRDALFDRLAQTAGDRPRVAISPRTAWLTSTLLERVVSKGHSQILRATKLPAAGKTGTSSATMDEWLVAYTSKWMTTTWIGDDLRERMLGYKDASYMQAVPTYARFLYEVARTQPLQKIPWERPEGVKASDIGGPLPGKPVLLDLPKPGKSAAPPPGKASLVPAPAKGPAPVKATAPVRAPAGKPGAATAQTAPPGKSPARATPAPVTAPLARTGPPRGKAGAPVTPATKAPAPKTPTAKAPARKAPPPAPAARPRR